MEKVIIIGCPGSGKSTFAQKLHKIIAIPLYHLDMMYWNSDKTTVSREVFLSRLVKVLQKDSWIIDGNYLSTMEMRLSACDTVIFLDIDTKTCLEGIKERRGKARADMPWVESEEDEEFTAFIRSFTQETRPQIMNLLSKYPEKQIIILKDRASADDFLENLQKQL